MADITLRTVKGQPLTIQEVDDNFSNLNTDKLDVSNNLSDVQDAAQARTNLDVDQAGTAVALAIALG